MFNKHLLYLRPSASSWENDGEETQTQLPASGTHLNNMNQSQNLWGNFM